jgi:hypothetical protein
VADCRQIAVRLLSRGRSLITKSVETGRRVQGVTGVSRDNLAVLLKGLYYRNLLLLKGPFCLSAMAFYKVFIEFPFGLSRDFF